MGKEYIEDVLKETFLSYGAFVLQRRALPDARDMFKYTARQIIHAQSREKLDHKHPFKKSQKSTAAATSFSYVHGGASAYGQIIRMGRPLVQRYFLEEITGNYGTPTDSGNYAAERYTEARLSELSDVILTYLNMEVIEKKDWDLTYDEEGEFPRVFPSVGYYNICNGSFGSIGVGLISSIPQFNLNEVNKAICNLIDNPKIEISLLPDFASGGILLNPKTTLKSLSIGEGKSALLRGVIKKYPKEGYLEVLEIPYGVYTDTICIELERAINDEEQIIDTFKDLSKSTVQLRVYSKDLDKLEQWLYQNTSIQKHFTIKLTLLDNGKTPKLMNIKEALMAHITHAKKVFRAQYLYQIKKLKERQNILEGLIKAHSILTEVIEAIRKSNGRADVIETLITSFEFNEAQAEYIADLKTHRWSAFDILALKKELEKNLLSQSEIQKILKNKNEFNSKLKAVYEEVATKFGGERLTKISTLDSWESGQEGTNPIKDFWLIKTDKGYEVSYSNQIENKIIGSRVDPEEDLIFITNKFRGFLRKGKQLPLGELSFSTLIKLNDNENIVAIIKKMELTQFPFVEILESDKEPYCLHNSFIINNSTQRGKKITLGDHNIINIDLKKEESS